VDSLPVFDVSRDPSRLVYNISDESLNIGTENEWSELFTAETLSAATDSSSAIQINKYTIDGPLTIPIDYHGMSVGPLELEIDAIITVSDGSVWAII